MAILIINELWMAQKPGRTAAFWLRVARHINDNGLDPDIQADVDQAIAAVDAEITAELQQAAELRRQAQSLSAQASTLERQAARGE